MKGNTSLNTVAVEDRAPSPPPASMPVVFEAIVKRQALAATYNRGTITIAPHIVYTKHGELYVDATTLEREGKPPREIKMGAFKISGLGGVRITPRRFEPADVFDSSELRYAGTTLLAIDR